MPLSSLLLLLISSFSFSSSFFSIFLCALLFQLFSAHASCFATTSSKKVRLLEIPRRIRTLMYHRQCPDTPIVVVLFFFSTHARAVIKIRCTIYLPWWVTRSHCAHNARSPLLNVHHPLTHPPTLCTLLHIRYSFPQQKSLGPTKLFYFSLIRVLVSNRPVGQKPAPRSEKTFFSFIATSTSALFWRVLNGIAITKRYSKRI